MDTDGVHRVIIEGHDSTVVAAVRYALDEVVGIGFDEGDLDRDLEDTGVDSLDLIEVVMVVEEALEISVDSEAFSAVETLREAIIVFERYRASV